MGQGRVTGKNYYFLGNLRVKNGNKGLNIKFDQLKLLVQGKVDFPIITETKSDLTFLTCQFMMNG